MNVSIASYLLARVHNIRERYYELLLLGSVQNNLRMMEMSVTQDILAGQSLNVNDMAACIIHSYIVLHMG